jgi:surfeit locus 1 family protein
MKLRSLLAVVIVVTVAAVCVRLGFWQISRWHEKQRLNAAQRAALVAPPVELGSEPVPLDEVRGRRVRLRGRFDETRQVLLAGRAHDGAPGVDVVTPLLLDGGSAVLVDRGWLYAADAATARPQDHPEPGEHEVTGLVEPLARARRAVPTVRLAAREVTLWSASALDPDTLARRFPYPLAPYVVRQLPGPGVPARPLRSPLRPYDETMHVSYAIQWFLFAAILVGGSLAVVSTRRRRSVPAAADADPELYRKD